jgi:hypothetical protein
MRGRTKRQADEERSRRLVARARELFIEIAEKHRLTLEWDECDQVELAAYLNRQPGLDWSLWLNLQNEDEIGVQSDWFYVEWFPADDPSREAEFVAALDGLISGSVRLVCKFGAKEDRPYSVMFEAETDSGWTNISSYYKGFHFSRPKGVMVLRNGHDPVVEGRASSISPPE